MWVDTCEETVILGGAMPEPYAVKPIFFFFAAAILCVFVDAPGQLSFAENKTAVTPQTVPEIEQAIAALADPIDQEHVDIILAGIAGLSDLAEQNRLQDLLHEQVGRRMRGDAETADEAPAQAEAVPDDMIEKRVEALSLGPSASDEQRRERDKVLSLIKAMPDDERREKFLILLEEKEQKAGTVVPSASPTASQKPGR